MRLVALLLALASGLPFAPQEGDPAAEATPLALRVNAAIARGVARLRAQQRPDGSWPGEEGPHPGGTTSLVCFTLLKSGVPRRDGAVQRGIASIGSEVPKSTYSAAVHLLLLDALGEPNAQRERAKQDLDALVGFQAEGLWPYPWGAPDMSNTQFALLGLRAAHRLGLEVPADALESCAKSVLRLQSESGGFPYEAARVPTAGITAATLGGLAVIAELGAGKPVERLLKKRAKEVDAATRWLETHFDPTHNRHGELQWTPSFHYAYLWAVERYCGLTGRDALGGRDWYSEGAEFLVGAQASDGSFGRGIPDTCFALLFLRRATVTAGGELDEAAALAPPARAPELHPEPGVPQLVDWLLCGPFGGGPKDDPLTDLPFDPARAKPKEGAKLERREWKRVALKPEGWTELEEVGGRAGDRLLWVLALRVANEVPKESAAEPVDALLWLTLEDGWRVDFDGALASEDRRVAAPIEETVRVPLRIEPGEHTLLVLVEDWVGASAFAARMTDAEGRALPDSIELDADFGGRKR